MSKISYSLFSLVIVLVCNLYLIVDYDFLHICTDFKLPIYEKSVFFQTQMCVCVLFFIVEQNYEKKMQSVCLCFMKAIIHLVICFVYQIFDRILSSGIILS